MYYNKQNAIELIGKLLLVQINSELFDKKILSD